MKFRTLIIFSIFIVVAIVASLFVYLYRNQTNRLLGLYQAKITTCGNILSESDCYARDFCEGIYQPSCPTCDDAIFTSCQRVPAKAAAAIVTNRQLCQNTGGVWSRTNLGNFCLCDQAGMNKIFDSESGCVSR